MMIVACLDVLALALKRVTVFVMLGNFNPHVYINRARIVTTGPFLSIGLVEPGTRLLTSSPLLTCQLSLAVRCGPQESFLKLPSSAVFSTTFGACAYVKVLSLQFFATVWGSI